MKGTAQIPWLCHRLRLARETLGLTLAGVGDKMGVQRAFISNLELGRKEPKLSTIIRYADILGIDLATLFKGCPITSGYRELPSVEKCRSILQRLGVNPTDIELHFDEWSESWLPRKNSEWGLADELVWLDLLEKLNSKKWRALAAKQALDRVTAQKDALASGTKDSQDAEI